ncbi:MAG: hypothetical protein IGR92_15675, partial [Leptolyngbyaceae cyanobacterium T60_A2020_046]|nr:hypothetical protein [Leptolyngbyaceae cyanobacterium T60_A2020_046]
MFAKYSAVLLSGGASIFLATALASTANAATLVLETRLTDGPNIGYQITLDDDFGGSGIRATIETASGLGDIAAVYFDVSRAFWGNLIFTEVSSEGADGRPDDFITAVNQSGNAGGFGGGLNMAGPGKSNFNVGLRVGNRTINDGDDFQAIVFDVTTQDTERELALTDFGAWGIRTFSVERNNGNRTGVSKSVARSPLS